MLFKLIQAFDSSIHKMKKTYLNLLAAISILASCNSNSTQNINTENAESRLSKAATSECYAYTANNDSVFLHINISNTIVTGDLNYNLFEKDKSTGTLSGIVHGDTIIAEYKFLSEGKESIREVAFLKTGDNLIEGFGEVEERQNKMVFNNIRELNFNGSMILFNIPCEK